MKKLCSMVDFVILQRQKEDTDNIRRFWACERYANFLKQPLELWMFVPCDENGEVLEEPNRSTHTHTDIECEQYKQAKNRCLFEGFEYCESQSKGMLLRLNLFVSPYTYNRLYLSKKEPSGYHSWFQLFTIEDLVQCGLELTPTAIKQIGL